MPAPPSIVTLDLLASKSHLILRQSHAYLSTDPGILVRHNPKQLRHKTRGGNLHVYQNGRPTNRSLALSTCKSSTQGSQRAYSQYGIVRGAFIMIGPCQNGHHTSGICSHTGTHDGSSTGVT
jgi:hypothetical protein